MMNGVDSPGRVVLAYVIVALSAPDVSEDVAVVNPAHPNRA